MFELILGVLLALVGFLFLRFRREIGDALKGGDSTPLGLQPARRRNTSYNPIVGGALFVAAGVFCVIWGIAAITVGK
jgi:hypothetical protein